MSEVNTLAQHENTTLKKATYVLAPAVYAAITALLIYVIVNSGKWPAGDDVMYHIYRGEKVYDAIAKGDLWPAFDTQWYNGVELLRYWSPLAAYLMAACRFFAGGDSMNGYLVFTGLVYFVSAISWYLIGLKKERPAAGLVIGALWFFLPQNVTYYFGYGNLAGMLGIACVVPWMIYFLSGYLKQPSAKTALGLALSTMLMGFCHSGFALLSILVMLIWLLIRKIMDHGAKNGGRAIVIMALGFLLTGVWFIASRKGVAGVDYTEQFAAAFQSLADTLDPSDRSKTGFEHYYFGLSVFIIGILGIFFSEKKTRPGFILTVVICLLTSETAYLLIRLIPGSTMLWTSRMISTALAVFLFSMLEWRTLRKPLQIIMAVIIVADSALSFGLIAGAQNGYSVSSRFGDEQNGTLITKAKKITKQRIALIDGSELASLGAYLTSTWKGENDTSFGAGYEAAVTRKNITMLNRAAVDGCYDYLFDRSLELGDDTVLIRINQLKHKAMDRAAVDKAAGRSGYALSAANGEALLYHRDVPGSFGTISEYEGIAIGKNASDIAEFFPAFREADETDVSKYTYGELSKYRVVYLDGFKAENQARAEKILKKLSENGVRIVVAADGIPDKLSGDGKRFLGVSCNKIKFENGYPEMDTKDGVIDTDLFPKGSEKWNTVYLNGLDKVWGSVSEQGNKLPFYGTAENDNIVFIGLNLTYYYQLTEDQKIGKLLSDAMDIKPSELPKRSLVPVSAKAESGGLRISTQEDDVNTTLAFHDIFSSKQKISSEHGLLHVNRGTTVIRYRNRYILPGMLVTLAAAGGLAYVIRREDRKKKRRESK